MRGNTNQQAPNDELVYEAPAIIYDGDVSTRAGSVSTGDAPQTDTGTGVDLFDD